ncbi:unnamed protein product [Phytophthora lilii]|uniref:Unnamed protein product n=1 Tax=Phytophthora lilii TaxID=2077276 RepID=A0A9W6TEW4_9STRA|nr:unnamed protein product [Phytophthora lilii]
MSIFKKNSGDMFSPTGILEFADKMEGQVWFRLRDGEGNTIGSADYVDCADGATIAQFRKVLKECPNILARVDAPSLTVFENEAAYKAKQALAADAKIGSFGGSKRDALVVTVSQSASSVPAYFILPETREKVAQAAFVITEEDEGHTGVGSGVFFSPTLAVTCNHNLTEQHSVGSVVPLAFKEEMVNVEVVARNSELDFAILKSNKPRPFIAPWSGNPVDLELRFDLVLASFRLGITEHRAPYPGKLGFAPATCIAISPHRSHILYSCPIYAGDSGAALILKDGFLVGLHLETINALREKMDRKKVTKARLNAAEKSLEHIVRSGLTQGCSGLLAHAFKNLIRE